jgi:hypothetical protein
MSFWRTHASGVNCIGTMCEFKHVSLLIQNTANLLLIDGPYSKPYKKAVLLRNLC